jgi:hypothetical protein
MARRLLPFAIFSSSILSSSILGFQPQNSFQRMGGDVFLPSETGEGNAGEVHDLDFGLGFEVTPKTPARHGTEAKELFGLKMLQGLFTPMNEKRMQFGKEMQIGGGFGHDGQAEPGECRSHERGVIGMEAGGEDELGGRLLRCGWGWVRNEWGRGRRPGPSLALSYRSARRTLFCLEFIWCAAASALCSSPSASAAAAVFSPSLFF